MSFLGRRKIIPKETIALLNVESIKEKINMWVNINNFLAKRACIVTSYKVYNVCRIKVHSNNNAKVKKCINWIKGCEYSSNIWRKVKVMVILDYNNSRIYINI